ncbi:MAG: ABC transporter ATP-binding protein [bacterium]
MSSVIELKNLTKDYGKKRAISDVNLKVEKGEIFGFLGPNGAGKTTTIKTLLNFYKPTKGEAFIFGKNSRDHYEEIYQDVSYMPGDVQLYDRMTANKMIKFASSLFRDVDKEYTKNLAKRLDCEMKVPYKKLSKGNKQKIGILMALFHKPKLLVLDEPTSGLDPLSQQELYKILRELKNEGTTIFFSSHNLAEVEKICDRIGIIKEGKLVTVETVEEIRKHRKKRVEIIFGQEFKKDDFASIPGVEVLGANGEHLNLYAKSASMDELLNKLSQYKIIDITAYFPDLEEIFLKYYETEK